MRRRLEEYRDGDENEVQRGRRVYVRFVRTLEKHSGPFFGPYAELQMRDHELVGVTPTGREELVARRLARGWDLPGRGEPTYGTYTIVPS